MTKLALLAPLVASLTLASLGCSSSSSSGSCTPLDGTYVLTVTNASSNPSGCPSLAETQTESLSGYITETEDGGSCTTSGCTSTCTTNVGGVIETQTSTYDVTSTGLTGTITITGTESGLTLTCSYPVSGTKQ